ncbi:uncharacterized protein [Haliotis cracherodii]|uniref:uncharacterized protein n=1 Tax=Haliotis cracherodii TaxID=6455 RepID=UPI0039E8F674
MAHFISGSNRNDKKRRLEAEIFSSDDDVSTSQTSNSWARFIVVESRNQLPLKINPFAISKAIEGICGEVKNVSRLRSGSLLVECARRQQAINLLKCTSFANTEVVVSEHRTLNSSRGIIRDRACCLAEMSEDDILEELTSQNVTSLKRFNRKDGKNIVPTNTYVFSFSLPTIPQSIKVGYFNIGVEVYVPNPLRCYKCQKFGHGSKSCDRPTVCHRCGGNHDGTGCTADLKCTNCKGEHVASSKSCPFWTREKDIFTIKCQNNISYFDAKKLFDSRTPSSKQFYAAAAAAVSRPSTSRSIECQTDLTWTHSEHPLPLTTSYDSQTTHSISPGELSPDSIIMTQVVAPSTPTPDIPATNKPSTEMAKKQKKKQNRKITTKIPTLTDTSIDVHNFFEPLEMDVTPSSHHNSGDSSSRLRERSPVEPP